MANPPINGQSNISRRDPYVPSKEVLPIKNQPESFAQKDTLQTACCCSCFSTIWQGICNFFSSIWNGLFGKSHTEPSEQPASTSPLVFDTAFPQPTASSSSSQSSFASLSSSSSSTLSASASSTASAASEKYTWANAIIAKYEEVDSDFTYPDLDEDTLEQFKSFSPKEKLEFLIELTNVNFKADRKKVPPEILAAFIQNITTDDYLFAADWNDLQSKATKVETYLDLHQALKAFLIRYQGSE